MTLSQRTSLFILAITAIEILLLVLGPGFRQSAVFLFLIRSIGFDTSIQRGIFFSKIPHVYFLWIYSFECNSLINKYYSSGFARKNSEKVRKRQPNIFDIFSIHSWWGNFLLFPRTN